MSPLSAAPRLRRRAVSRSRALALVGVLLGSSALVVAVEGAASAAALPATAYDPSICTAAVPPPGFTVKDRRGTNNNDEIVISSSDTTSYIVYAGGGDDGVVGGGGSDILCGEGGDDGLRGGPGADLIVGSVGRDFLSGGNDSDEVYGGDDDDAVYGGYGDDFMSGDAGSDFVRRGPGSDSGDANTSFTTCPPWNGGPWYASLMGTFSPPRLSMQNSCASITGYIKYVSNNGTGDGDLHFKVLVYSGACGNSSVTEYTVEFMPRDKPQFHGVIDWSRNTCNNKISLTGAKVKDCGHSCGLEIHPVFQLTYQGVTRSSGPQYGGSPWSMNPSSDQKEPKFCWNELGGTCNAWDPSVGGNFS